MKVKIINKQTFFLLSKELATGFINDTEIRFFDKTDLSDPTRHEDFWIGTLKTCYPQGLNSIDPYH